MNSWWDGAVGLGETRATSNASCDLPTREPRELYAEVEEAILVILTAAYFMPYNFFV